MTPLISHEERSSVITHESTPSVSIIIALEQRSRVNRTSFESERERRLRRFCILYEHGEYVCNRSHPTLLLLLTSRRCQRPSATPMLLLFNRRTRVPEPWLIFRLGVPPISSEEKTKKKCQIMFLFLPDNRRQINLMETRGITLFCSWRLKTALLLSLTLGG